MLRIKQLFKIKVPLFIVVITIAIIVTSFYWISAKTATALNSQSSAIKEIHGGNCSLQLTRENRSGLVKPLLLSDLGEEDQSLIPLKQAVESFINQEKSAGILKSASVYVRLLNNGNWMSINEAETYSPGSLMKVPTLITILKEAETNHAVLEKKILFKKHFGGIPSQTITGPVLKEGNYYKVKELLEYMIMYSDNDATALLNGNLKFDIMVKLFKDLKFQEPNYMQQDYLVNCSDYSKFFRILYNSSYLNYENSELALRLLSRSTFKEGLIKYTDSSVTVSHKFGERNNNGEQQLHEFGVYYINNNPYLIGVMTKGNDYKILPDVISEISKIVFEAINKKQQISS